MTVSPNTKARFQWPSFGFFLLLGSHVLLAGLMLWGWQRPALDEAFEVLARRDLSDASTATFSADDVQLLHGVWLRHPGFGRALLGKSTAKFLEPTEAGWMPRSTAHLAIRPEVDHPTQLSIEARGLAGEYPIHVRIHSAGIERRLDLLPDQSQNVEWSANELKQPSIFDVEVTAAPSHSTGLPTRAIRVTPISANIARETHD